MKFFATLALLALPFCAFAQQPGTDKEAEQEKQLYESVEKTVDRFADLLDLDDTQIFWVDSILTHDYRAMISELDKLNKAKVSNPDFFIQVQDNWNERIYDSFHKIFNEEQWAKYLKSGAAREKKSRDKRAAKRK